jgi:hypothetical protein
VRDWKGFWNWKEGKEERVGDWKEVKVFEFQNFLLVCLCQEVLIKAF